mmetsp:Transcript_74051/g.214508  ORF Transcript_74051/g.214508 Transcript_74051/m.214508 type:complete len:172 (+) Transcript_74051:153-668(+)
MLAQCQSECSRCQDLNRCCDDNADAWREKAEVVDLTTIKHSRIGATDRRGVPMDTLPSSGADASAAPVVSQGAGVSTGSREPFDVELVRVGEHWRTLGLLVSPDDDPRFLIVDDIWEPSLVSQWNEQQPEAYQIKPGHIIQAVNGVSAGGEDMLARIQASGRGSILRLRVC